MKINNDIIVTKISSGREEINHNRPPSKNPLSVQKAEHIPSTYSRWKKIEKYLNLFSEVGTLVMGLRDKPRLLDWMGAGLRGVNLAFKIRSEFKHAYKKDAEDYFSNGKWMYIPGDFSDFIFSHARNFEILDEYWDGEESSERVFVGEIDNEVVAFSGTGLSSQDVSMGPYLLKDRADIALYKIGLKIWNTINSRHCIYMKDKITADDFELPDNFYSTKQLKEIENRIKLFLDKSINRSILFQGPPGAGKTLGARFIAKSLGLSSMRIDLNSLLNNSSDITYSIETLIKLMKPDVLLIDDLDRVGSNQRLLSFLELAMKNCKLALVTANSTDRMDGALLRPGRFDEIIRVNKLDKEVISILLGDDKDLTEQLEDSPVSYIMEFIKRSKALGSQQAREELKNLEKHMTLVNRDKSSDSKFMLEW